MSNNNSVRKTISYLDKNSSNFGFSQSRNFGLAEELANLSTVVAQNAGQPAPRFAAAVLDHVTSLPADMQAALMPHAMNAVAMNASGGTGNGVMPNSTINPYIAQKTRGKSTFMVTVTVKQTGGGAPEADYPVFFFGGSSLNNSATPYLQVANAGQVISNSVVGGKNTIVIKYVDPADDTKYTTYTISLGTTGEYPLIVNSLSGTKEMQVYGIQTEISDVTKQSQLSSEIYTFEFDEYGKAITNDLTTPIDLYQQSDGGIFMPHEFPISSMKGMVNNVLNVNNFVVKYYFYANTIKA